MRFFLEDVPVVGLLVVISFQDPNIRHNRHGVGSHGCSAQSWDMVLPKKMLEILLHVYMELFKGSSFPKQLRVVWGDSVERPLLLQVLRNLV